MIKTIFTLLTIACVFAQSPATAAPALPAGIQDQSKLALLSSTKQNLTNDDLSAMFTQDLSALSSAGSLIDDACSSKLDAALKAAASDPNALSFIFTQATEGKLCVMLSQKPADVDAAMSNFKDTESFAPVSNSNAKAAPASIPAPATAKLPNIATPTTAPTTTAAPTIAPITTTAPAATTKSNNTNEVKTANNVDPKVVAAQKAKQDEQMKAAQDAINNLFSQVNTKMNMNSAMPNINFGAAPTTTASANMGSDLGAGLARVPATPSK